MTRKDIVKALEDRGYKAEETEISKNGISFKGIVIGKERVAPIIYTDDLIAEADRSGRSLYSVVAEVIEIYKRNKEEEIPITLLLSKKYFTNHVFVGIQKKSDLHIEKRSCELDPEGLETYLYLKYEGCETIGTITINAEFLREVGIDREEAWTAALRNVCEHTTVESLDKIMSDAFGIPYDPAVEPDLPLYIISNADKVKGAGAILNKERLKEFGKKYGADRLVILPSSIHEMLIFPYFAGVNLENMRELVKEINLSDVAPEERLTNSAYIMEL